MGKLISRSTRFRYFCTPQTVKYQPKSILFSVIFLIYFVQQFHVFQRNMPFLCTMLMKLRRNLLDIRCLEESDEKLLRFALNFCRDVGQILRHVPEISEIELITPLHCSINFNSLIHSPAYSPSASQRRSASLADKEDSARRATSYAAGQLRSPR